MITVKSLVTLSVDRGTEEYLNCKGRVDIINSTLGKALGGGAGMNPGGGLPYGTDRDARWKF